MHSTFYDPHLEIKVGDTVVERTETTPLLGIQVQTDFKHEATLAKLVAKLQHIARQLTNYYANELIPLEELRKNLRNRYLEPKQSQRGAAYHSD